VLLLVFWAEVPDRWITHWGPRGPDGWATKSYAAAMAPLVIGFLTWLLFEAVAMWMARREPTSAFPSEMLGVQAAVVRASGLAVSLLIAGLTVALPFLQPRSPMPIVVATVADVGLIVGFAMLWAARRTRRLRDAGVPIPEGYRGVFYRDPRDSRLWVPRVAGIGWTINFAHRLAWPVMIALVAAPLVMFLVISLAAR
jgi:uncharacterized membrane protein